MSKVERGAIAEVASLNNLALAAQKARRGKSRRPDVEAFFLRQESEILQLHEELASGAWRPAGYRFFEIREPKRRMIAAAPFRDRVVHHALCNILQPVLERRFIARSFSCQVGKGTTAARDCCRRLVNRHRYVLKCDIRKFFPSLDHAIIEAMLSRHVRCEGVLALCRHILASHRTDTERPRGLPIGNLTSQLWGNLYLDGLDHWVTETRQHGDYLRYTDDFLIFSDDKEQLWKLRDAIRTQLDAIKLILAEPKSRLIACSEGVPYLGAAHALFPHAAKLTALAQGVRDAIGTMESAVRASKMADAEEEIAQAALRKQYEGNYLAGRGTVGRAIAERLFPKANRGQVDTATPAPEAPK